jgi:PAS domain S-box-containing protein
MKYQYLREVLMVFRIAFLSVNGNCRGHMACTLAKEMAPADVEVVNLSNDATAPLPQAIEVSREMGHDISNQISQSVMEASFQPIDLVIELSDRIVANRSVLPGIPSVLHWDFPEPVDPDGQVRSKTLHLIYTRLREKINDFFNNGYCSNLMVQQRNNLIVLDESPDAILTHDANRKIIWVNRAAERILGYDRSEIVGRDCLDIFPEKFCGANCQNCQSAAKLPIRKNYPIRITAKDGQSRHIDMSVVQMSDEYDIFQGVMINFHDVTEMTHLRRHFKKVKKNHGLIGADDKMQGVYELIRDVAASDCTVLIQGESGTGKELVAMAIHAESRRYDKPMVTVNCAALPENILESELFGHVRGAFTGAIRDKKGRFMLAAGGTIFLDEIGELTASMQIKLLRVLQEKTFDPVGADAPVSVDVRIISATNQNLRNMVKQGRFREDLYYRLCVVPVTVPALRERRNDIALLANHFIEQLRQENHSDIKAIDPQALVLLTNYHWPGNIGELQNAIQYAFIKCKDQVLKAEHFPQEIPVAISAELSPSVGRKRKLTAAAITQALKESRGNKVKAAQILGVGRATLYRSLNEN